MKVKQKVVVVTGAGSGIGRALTLELLAKGASVAAVDMRKETLDQLSKTVNDEQSLSTHVVDITDRQEVEKLVDAVNDTHGQVDGVINNAGIIQPFVAVNELDYESIDKVMQVNFWGTLYMVKSFLPDLLKRPEAHIVNVSSMGGFLPVPGQSLYGASKAAVKLLTEGLYAELKHSPVAVSVVFPGATQTDITKNSQVKTPTVSSKSAQTFPSLSAEEVAKQIVSGIEKNKPLIYTGKDSRFMNKLYRLSPVYATNLIAKQMKSLLSQ